MRFENGILFLEAVDVLAENVEKRLERLEATLVLQMRLFGALGSCVGMPGESTTRTDPTASESGMRAEHRCLLAVVGNMKREATLDGDETAKLANNRFGRAGLGMFFELIEAEQCIAGWTGHFTFGTREAMSGPILAHDFGRASTAFALGEVLVDVLKRAVGSDMASKQVTLAFVVASLVFVWASDTERVDHVFDEEGRGLEIGKIERGSAGRAALRCWGC